MLLWLAENWGTLLTGAVLLLLVGAAVLCMVRRKRQGKSPCGCGCAGGCPHCTHCAPAPKQ